MIKTIIFDIGGVCLTEINWAEIISKKYKLPPNEIKELIREQYYKRCALSSEKSTMFWKDLKEKFNIDDNWKDIRITPINYIIPIKETIDLIRKLKNNGYEILFFSNSHIDFTPEIVEKYKLLKEFDNGLFSHEHPFFKPDKKFYEKLLTITTSKPNEMIYVDDIEKNLIPAKELGMHVILFENSEQLIKNLKKLAIRI